MRVSAVSRCALSRSATMGNQLGSGINRGDNSLAATGSHLDQGPQASRPEARLS
jgi:hypothetical protein